MVKLFKVIAGVLILCMSMPTVASDAVIAAPNVNSGDFGGTDGRSYNYTSVAGQTVSCSEYNGAETATAYGYVDAQGNPFVRLYVINTNVTPTFIFDTGLVAGERYKGIYSSCVICIGIFRQANVRLTPAGVSLTMSMSTTSSTVDRECQADF